METPLTQDAKALGELKLKRDEAKAVADQLNNEYLRAEAAFLERLESENCDGIKVDGRNFVPAETTYAQVQDRAEFVAWAQENDDELIEHKERKALINQLVRERLDNGETLPPGLGFYVKEYVSVRAD